MVDTVTACINDFEVTNASAFCSNTVTKAGAVTKDSMFQNLPHCRLEVNNISRELYFRASLPHLVYGASLFEMQEDDIGKSIGRLQAITKDAGVKVTESALSQARVHRIDFCKNITVEHACQDYVSLLDNFRMPKSDKINYKLETLTFGANSKNKQICIYNKVRQVAQVRDKAERELAAGRAENILRFESRLLNNRTIKKEVKSPLYLYSIFNKQQATAQLLRDFNRIKDVQETQMSLNFNEDVELLKYLIKTFGNRALEAFLGVKDGAANILRSFRFEYSAVLELFREAGQSKGTAYKNADKLFRYNSIKPLAENRGLINELREKLAA